VALLPQVPSILLIGSLLLVAWHDIEDPVPLPRQSHMTAPHILGNAGELGEAVPEAQKLPLYEVSKLV
jgi:hypothetical protein